MGNASRESSPLDLTVLRSKADGWMLAALAFSGLFAVGIGAWRGQPGLAAGCALALLLAGLAMHQLVRGTLLSRSVFPVLLMSMVALHIHLGAGQTVFHFGVFVALAFLLLYRDWRSLVIGAATIALHHVAFDRLQALGFPVYCLSAPDFAAVCLHAAYVVVQSAFEIVIGERMRRDALQANELHLLLARLQQGDRLALGGEGIAARTTGARRLQEALDRIAKAIGDVDRASGEIGSAAVQIAHGQGELSARTEEAASSLAETSGAMHQLTDAVRHNAGTARQANALAGEAVEAATRGGAVEIGRAHV